MKEDRAWVAHAIHIIEADFNRSADTHLLRVPLPGTPEIALYLKDESTHPTGSLKHRLARSLFLYGLCNGWIGPKTPIFGGIERFDCGFGSVLCPHAWSALHRRRAALHLSREGCTDRVLWRRNSFCGAGSRYLRRERPSRRIAWRPLHGPVHLRGAGNGLARQQQHRRIDLHSNG